MYQERTRSFISNNSSMMINLNSFYGDGLRYYLHVKRTNHLQLFGNYLLCFRYWLTMDNKNLDRHYRIVMQQVVDKKAQPSWAGFYYASQLYHASKCREKKRKVY